MRQIAPINPGITSIFEIGTLELTKCTISHEIPPGVSITLFSAWSTVIQCYFDHDGMARNPGHRACYPIVSACAREITFPVIHMQEGQTFHGIFIMAFCKGHAFGRH